jgi:hypothetical protein
VLTSGDSGILRSIDATHYAAAAAGGRLHTLDRDVFVHNMQLDLTEAHFKRALAMGRQDDIVRLVKSNKLVGQVMMMMMMMMMMTTTTTMMTTTTMRR